MSPDPASTADLVENRAHGNGSRVRAGIDSPRRAYFMKSGLSGEPLAPTIGIGAATKRPS